MTGLLLLFLALILPTAVHAQAMRPPPTAAGPLITQPPPPGQPSYTPAGAGASHGGLAAPAAAVPRSPNKRLLPPTKEAGLWAADGAPVAAASGRRKVFGVEIPAGPSVEDQTVVAECSGALADVMKISSVLDGYIARSPENVRRCLAAKAFLYCAKRLSEELQAGRLPHPTFAPNAIVPTTQRAAMMERSHCAGVELDQTQKDVLDTVTHRWETQELGQRLKNP